MLNSPETFKFMSMNAQTIFFIAIFWSLLICGWSSDDYKKYKSIFAKALCLVFGTFLVGLAMYFPFVVIAIFLFFGWA